MLRSLTLHAQKRLVRRSVYCFSTSSGLRLQGPDVADCRLARKQSSDPSAKLPIGNSNAFLRSVASDIQALENLYQSLANDSDAAQNFQQCVMRVLKCRDENHRVFVTGIGKSGAVAKRLASTLASVSVSSQYVHGGEWIHGELGGLKQGDTVIIISHSGRTAELLPLPKRFHKAGCYVVTVVGDNQSPLSQLCDLVVSAAAEDEAGCPVPSRSIIVQEAICNAIVQHLIECMNDGDAHLRESHPGGSIGARLASD